MSDRKITLVTVAYGGEYESLRIQARSIGLYASRDLVDRILVVENFEPGGAVDWRETLRADYGPIADLVEFIAAAEIADLPAASGWWTQQILKFEVARLVTTEVYLLLDGKHHLVFPLRRSFIESDDGRLRVRGASYEGHALRNYLDRAMQHFALPSADHVTFFPTTTPPFPIYTGVAREIVDYASQQKQSLARFMLDERITEFFLYSAYLTSRGRLTPLYELHSIPYPVVWKGQHDLATCVGLVETSKRGESPFFGVHRAAVGEMDDASLRVIAAYWSERGLFATIDQAMAKLLEIQQGRQDARTRTDWSKTPKKIMRRLRSLLQR